MVEVDMSDENAERQLLELIRLQDSQNFTVTIACDSGQWSVSSTDHDGMSGGAVGRGDSFAEAWFRQNPIWAHKG